MDSRPKDTREINFSVTDVQTADGLTRFTAHVQNVEDTDVATKVAGTIANVKQLLAEYQLTMTDVEAVNLYLPTHYYDAAQELAIDKVRLIPSSAVDIKIEITART